MKEYILENKKTIIIVSGFILFLIILNMILNSLGTDNKVLLTSYVSKLDRDDIKITDNACDIENALKYNNVPYFEYNSQIFNDMNEEIIETFLLRACYQEGFIDYEASLNKNILSVALNISHETIDDLAYVEYKSYNINIDTNSKISNSTLLQKYNLNLSAVNNKVMSMLTKYYNYEKEKKHIENLSFNEYLEILEYENITIDNMILFVDDNNDLYILKDYTLSPGMSIDEEFPDLTIRFKLT